MVYYIEHIPHIKLEEAGMIGVYLIGMVTMIKYHHKLNYHDDRLKIGYIFIMSNYMWYTDTI